MDQIVSPDGQACLSGCATAIAARYVSGYLFAAGLAGETHVKIGHGRHYSDVPPIKGLPGRSQRQAGRERHHDAPRGDRPGSAGPFLTGA
jgi:hypothetical protein